MKRFVNVTAFMLFMVGIKAQVRDAFDGILPEDHGDGSADHFS